MPGFSMLFATYLKSRNFKETRSTALECGPHLTDTHRNGSSFFLSMHLVSGHDFQQAVYANPTKPVPESPNQSLKVNQALRDRIAL
jgi:hypothetical protein